MLFISCDKNKKKEVTIPQEIKVETPVTVVPEVVADSKPVFMVQIAAIKKHNASLDSLDGIHVFQENSLIKYRLGGFETYEEARKLRAQLIRKYKGAFVQALINDTPIHIKEALQF